LLELLVVMLIMGLVLSMVGLSATTGSASRQLTRSTELLAREMALQLQQAETDGDNRGMTLRRGDDEQWVWHWYRQVDGRWQRLSEAEVSDFSSPGGPLTMPVVMAPRLHVNGRPVPLAARATTQRNSVQRRAAPSIVFYASGEMTPFELRLESGDGEASAALVVCGNALGQIVLVSGVALSAAPCELDQS
jgi:type II secretion system protein H